MRRLWYGPWRWGLLGALAAVSVLVVGIVGGIIHDDGDGDGEQQSLMTTAVSRTPSFGLASPTLQSPTATAAALAPTAAPSAPTATPVSAGETPEATAPSAASPTETSTSVPAIPTATLTPVPPSPTATATPSPEVWYNLTPNAPSAIWYGTAAPGPLGFGGPDTDEYGFAMWRDNFELEDSSRPARVIEMHPPWRADSRISGEFILPGPVGATAHFKAVVGFLAGAGAGSVTFNVQFLSPDGSVLGEYNVSDSYDGALRGIDLNLAGCAAADRIRLSVYAGASAAQDWAVWLDPRIERVR